MSNSGDQRTGQYLNREGRPIGREQWQQLTDDRTYVRVGATELRAGRSPEIHVSVSTVWTGMNLGSGEIFESMVEQDGEVVKTVRYRSEDAARDGHNALVGEHIMVADLPGPRLVREIPAEET